MKLGLLALYLLNPKVDGTLIPFGGENDEGNMLITNLKCLMTIDLEILSEHFSFDLPGSHRMARR